MPTLTIRARDALEGLFSRRRRQDACLILRIYIYNQLLVYQEIIILLHCRYAHHGLTER